MSKIFSRATIAGATLSGANLKTALLSLWDALNTQGVTDVSRTTVTATATLTMSQCGLLLVDATAGNVVLTLPTSGAATDDATYEFRRIDNSVNSVTIQRGGTDTIDGVNSYLILGFGSLHLQLPAGSTQWRVKNISASTAAGARAAIGAAGAGANTDITSLASATTVTTQALTDISTKIASTAYAQAMSAKIQPVSASVAANALTCTLNPTVLDFRSATLTSGAVVSRTVASAINLVVPSGATLGTVSGQQSRLYLLALDNAGTVTLGVVNASGGNNLDESGVITTTAISGTSNSANVVYSAAGHTNVAYRVVGMVVSTQTTAGTWATAPSLIQGAGGNAVGALNSLGHGQTWQDVSGSRAFGTTYYNTTGKPIVLAVRCNNGSQSNYSSIVNGSTVQIVKHLASDTTTAAADFVIPPGASYSVSSSAGTPLTPVWMELR